MESQNRIPSSILKLVEIEGKGRGLVASQALRAGQIVMQDSPIYPYLVSPLKQIPDDNNFCHYCFRSPESSPPTSTCPSCSSAIFCSPTCQSSAVISTHTPWVCRTLTHLRNCPALLVGPEHRQIEARCLVAVFNLSMVSPSVFQDFLSLDGCGARDGRSYVDSAVFLHSVFSSSVAFPEGFSLPSVELMADILAKDWRNSFCLMGRGPRTTTTVRGYAVYLNASLFNHSCIPNACHFHYLDTTHNDGSMINTDLVLRVMRDVSQGEEICISYLRVNSSYSDRQMRLRDYYTFVCSCERCKAEEGGAEAGFLQGYLDRFMCKNESCQGFLAPLPSSCYGQPSEFMECNVCGELTKRGLDEA